MTATAKSAVKPEVITIDDEEEASEIPSANSVPVVVWSDDEDFQIPTRTIAEKKRKLDSGPSVPTKKPRRNIPPPPPSRTSTTTTTATKKSIHPVRIFYATRTHSQITQAVQELGKTDYRPLMSILGSRNQYCIHPKVSKVVNKDSEWYILLLPAINFLSAKLQDSHPACAYSKNIHKLVNYPELKPGGNNELWDIEDLAYLGKCFQKSVSPCKGKQHTACPFFAARKISRKAHLVFCPYQYLLEPGIRSSSKISLNNSIVIFDEVSRIFTLIHKKAHNIEDVCRDVASLDTNASDLSTGKSLH